MPERLRQLREVEHHPPRSDERAIGVAHLEARVLLALDHRVEGAIQGLLLGGQVCRVQQW